MFQFLQLHNFLRLILLIVCLNCCSAALGQDISYQNLQSKFDNPGKENKPWMYYYIINNHLSKKGITKDLETMADIGIGAVFVGNIYLENVKPDGKIEMLGDQWMETMEHLISEAQRLGIDVGLFNSPGWSQSGGPWNDIDNSMRYVKIRKEVVTGGKGKIKVKLPAKDFKPIASWAFPVDENDTILSENISFSYDSLSVKSLAKTQDYLIDLSGKNELDLYVDISDSLPIRSLSIKPAKLSTFFMDVKFYALVDNNWEKIREFEFDRTNDMNQLGFDDYPPVLVSFPGIEATKFKLEFSGIHRGVKDNLKISEINFFTKPKVEFYVEKMLGKMHQSPLPLNDAYKWRTQDEPEMGSFILDKTNMIDLSGYIDDDGLLEWEPPKGDWTIMQFGMATTGITNQPAAKEAVGLETDKMNRKALKQHFDGFVGKILKKIPESKRKSLKYVVADSYETGSQNWTDNFEISFKEEYGYDPREYLPVYSGVIVNSVDESNRFLWDVRRFIADRIATEYVGGLKDLCESNGLKLWLENYGHWGFPSEFLKYGGQSNFVGGEFWVEGSLGNIECRAASSAAHIYGMKKISAESFTAGLNLFARYPHYLKKRGDWSYTEGINHAVLHVYIHQPYDSIPGVITDFGTEFNRNNTWFDKSKAWIDYQRRNQVMLQQGNYVADVAYYIGEDVPKMTGVQEPKLPKGYSFDYINADVLLNGAKVKNGRILLDSGMSYKLLVLPKGTTMRPEVLKKIETLVSQGAAIMGNAPTKSPSLENYPHADSEIKAISKLLWPKVDADKKVNSYGKGHVWKYADLGNVLTVLNQLPDVDFAEGLPILWIHRKSKERDIYFLSNQGDENLKFDISFNVTGAIPQLWNPVSGSIRTLPDYSLTKEGFVKIPLEMENSESTYIVFEHDKKGVVKSGRNFPKPQLMTTVNKPWKVNFKSDLLNVNRELTMDSLIDWTHVDDQEIKYFSGTATYRNEFKLDKLPNNKLFLKIGKADVIAEIKINGKKVGTLWTNPWRIEISDYVKSGENKLEIKVTNLLVNQLIRDHKREEENRIFWSTFPLNYQDDQIKPSGLMGPVSISYDYLN